jgi:hypothetical protein
MVGTTSAFYYKNRLETLTIQKELNSKESMVLLLEITDLARDIRIATYPTECDALTKDVVGEECDIGNYMEWAGPALESETRQLRILVQDSQH